jgi:hypothetical protein
VESGWGHEQKSEVKNLVLLSLSGKFFFLEKQTVLKIFLVDFYNHPELRKRDWKVAELAGDCGIGEVKF